MAGVSERTRQSSNQWGRLKDIEIGSLESFGLPSKGDKRLLNFEAQESYLKEVVERYNKADSTLQGKGTELEERFASLTIADNNAPKSRMKTSLSTAAENERDTLLMAMRKLREGIVASKRADDFAVRAYSFCIRKAILAKHMESYHPALLHLLQILYPKTSSIIAHRERQEFVGYLILDLACRQEDYAGAFTIRKLYRLVEPLTDAVLQAMIFGHYHLFWETRKAANIYQMKLMEYAEERIRAFTIKCLERAYFTVDAKFLSDVTGMSCTEFFGEYKVPWEQDGQTVVIRRRNIR